MAGLFIRRAFRRDFRGEAARRCRPFRERIAPTCAGRPVELPALQAMGLPEAELCTCTQAWHQLSEPNFSLTARANAALRLLTLQVRPKVRARVNGANPFIAAERSIPPFC